MIKNDKIIRSMIFDPVKHLMDNRNIEMDEAKLILSEMSFKDYRAMEENSAIAPPSGDTIAPTAPTTPSTSQDTPDPTGPESKIKAIWPGGTAPVEIGMTVGLPGMAGKIAPGEVSKVDMAANGVMVKDPTTGKTEWKNMGDIEPYQAQQAESVEGLSRLRELAGIREDASCGATGAGAIAVAPTAMGGVKKRQPTGEKLEKEYKPKGPAKTIIGDTKPSQASGQLSANLAKTGKKTASRKNNGRKK